ncbi:hypothetical protein B6E66_20775 [Streptomyces maremycinicus]|nr:hypothetical protein B6E66_20775 [Streptomyces sp. B9173]
MTSTTPASTLCLHCAAPVELADAVATPGRVDPDTRRWCGRCMRSMDDWERFYLLYQPRLYRFCLTRMRGTRPGLDHVEAAKDIAQETMIIAHRKFEIWEAPERALWTTARHLIWAACREYTYVTSGGFPVTVRYKDRDVWESDARVVADPAEAVIDRVVLYNAMQQLPLEQQQALVTHKGLGLSAAEAGRVLARPGSTVKTQAHSALKQLREAAAKGVMVILPVGGAVGVYEVLDRVPAEAVESLATDLVNQPHVYPALLGLALRGIPYLRERFGRAKSTAGTEAVPVQQPKPRRRSRR